MMKRIFATLALLGAVAVGSVGNAAWAEEKPAAPAATAPAAAAPAAKVFTYFKFRCLRRPPHLERDTRQVCRGFLRNSNASTGG